MVSVGRVHVFSIPGIVWRQKSFLWFGAAVLGHQSLEMFLKAILIGTGHRAILGGAWGHDLLTLAKKVEKSGIQLPIDLAEPLREFNGFFNELRYPTALNKVSGLSGFPTGQEAVWQIGAHIRGRETRWTGTFELADEALAHLQEELDLMDEEIREAAQ